MSEEATMPTDDELGAAADEHAAASGEADGEGLQGGEQQLEGEGEGEGEGDGAAASEQEGGGEGDGEGEGLPAEPTDHGERSQLGRRVSDIERNVKDQMQQVLDRLESFTQGFQARPQQLQQPEVPAYEYDPYEEIPTTRGELEAWLDKRESTKQQIVQAENQRYESGYKQTFSELTRQHGDEAAAIEQEMLENFNIRYSNDPVADARYNYQAARNSLLEKEMASLREQVSKPELKLKGVTPKGGPSAQASAQSGKKPVKLDPIAAEFARSQGMSDEDVAKALEGDMPLNLVQGNINA